MPADDTYPFRVLPVLGMGLIAISVSAILIRFATDAPPEAVAFWRTFFAVILLVPFALFRAREEIMALTLREALLIGVSGVFLGLHFETWIESLYYTSVASASVLVSLSPIFVGVLGYLVLHERLKRVEVIAIAIAIAATVVLALARPGTGSAERPVLGNSLALTAALLVSVYLLIGRVVRQRRSWLGYVVPLYAATACTTLAVALVEDVPLTGYHPDIYLLCLGMAVIPQIMGHGALNYCVRYLPAGTIGMASLFEPVGASILAFFLFAEVPGPAAAVAMLVILLSVGAALRYRNR